MRGIDGVSYQWSTGGRSLKVFVTAFSTSFSCGSLDRPASKNYSDPMLRTVVAAIFLLCMAAPAWASEPESFDRGQPFEQALTSSLLRSLLDQALDRLEDHVEISGNLNPDETKSDRGKHLRFRFYPEGKSKSDEHFTAEGWFRSSPESGQHDWHFKFKRPEDRPQKSSSPQFDAPL